MSLLLCDAVINFIAMLDASETPDDATAVPKRKRLLCPYCYEPLEYRISRGMLVKLFLFW